MKTLLWTLASLALLGGAAKVYYDRAMPVAAGHHPARKSTKAKPARSPRKR